MSKQIENDGRLYFWDNAKGILIFLVVFGHMLYAYQDISVIRSMVFVIYSFHMPAFAFSSGYLSAKSTSKTSRSIIFLVAAYAVFNTIAILYFYFTEGVSVSLFSPYVSFWYLPALIAWRCFSQVVPKKPGIPVFLIAVALAVGFSGQIGSHMTITRIICFFPFFMAGAILPGERISSFLKNAGAKARLSGVLFLTLGLGGIVVLISRSPLIGEFLMGTYTSPAGLLNRLLIFLISGAVVTAGLLLIPRRRVPMLSSWGKNSLAVYLIHRFITLIAARVLPIAGNSFWILTAAVAGTLCILFIFGNDTSGRMIRGLIDGTVQRLSYSKDPVQERRNLLYRILAVVTAGTIVFLSVLAEPKLPKSGPLPSPEVPIVHTVLNESDQKRIDDAVCLSFVGDMILLKGQVIAAYDAASRNYDFAGIFDYAAPYMDADLSVGIFEGPMAGPKAGYSSSDFDDGLPLQLNFPDSFAGSVKEAGVDLVSLANNHILDKGVSGAYRTLDILDGLGLTHTGSYRNAEERDNVLILEADGLRIAFLSYTFGSNGYEEEYFMRENPTLTRLIVAPDSLFFEECRKQVSADFERARALAPDIIVAIPHMGSQFTHETDSFQQTWNGIFVREGADIILGDHSHAVQPIEFTRSQDPDGTVREALVVNCPGNFANSYVRYNGDATAVVKVYVDPSDAKIVCASIVPMWTHGTPDGYFRALPIYEIVENDALRSQLSSNDLERVREVQELVTTVMLGVSVPIEQAQDEYFMFPDGYRRQKVRGIDPEVTEAGNGQIAALKAADAVCFIGDSLTAGSNNGGYPWYEPIANAFIDKEYYSVSAGGLTSLQLLSAYHEALLKARADLFIIAVGANDIRYRDESVCAMTPEAYAQALLESVDLLRTGNPDAKFIFVAPWPALDNDRYTRLLPEDKSILYSEYTTALRDVCETNGFLFVDPTDRILEQFGTEAVSRYMSDHIHPNAGDGILLYSQAFLLAGDSSGSGFE